MATEASSRPSAGRVSLGARGDGLVGDVVELVAKSVVVDSRRGSEQLDGRFGSYESVPTHGCELADRFTVPCDDRGLVLDERAHDAAALVAKLSLADLSTHDPQA